ncbi:MAG TPA: molybdopterin-dependent oxidoreductase [Ktedonobacterales bacterium]|nr:molybdopterin-dependent oxidoreductase [Ktedonobacterales bacterium]
MTALNRSDKQATHLQAPSPPIHLRPRVTDWSLAVGVGVGAATGLVSLINGRPEQWIVFTLHGVVGLWLVFLLWDKVRRVWPRLVHLRRWDRRTVLGALALLAVGMTLASGVWWVAGGDLSFLSFNLLNWHIILGGALATIVGLHLLARAKPLRTRDLRGRRQALRFATFALGAVALWPAQQTAQRFLALPGAARRFTGSREADSFQGNAFPTSSWVADAPRPIDRASWRLHLGGAVAKPLTLTYDDLLTLAPGEIPSDAGDQAERLDALVALLDCTGGFYSSQRWRGVCIDRLLDLAEPHADARYVSFISVTSYRWSLPLAEARQALLATHVGDDALSHDHGAPLRLVAPGRRGFEWVKWITGVELRTEPDLGELIAIHTSGFTPEGRGER